MNRVPIKLEKAGGRWYHTNDGEGPNLSKASLGLFFHTLISKGAYIGEIFCLQPQYHQAAIQVTVYMTEEMKNEIEQETKFRFRDPPKINLN